MSILYLLSCIVHFSFFFLLYFPIYLVTNMAFSISIHPIKYLKLSDPNIVFIILTNELKKPEASILEVH